MITFRHKGNFKNTERFLSKAKTLQILSILERYGTIGVNALAAATPKDSGLTANSWDFNIEKRGSGWDLNWFNTHENNGSIIAILIQYGHGTGTGGYVQPNDYINPTMKPIFDKIAEDIWKEVSNL